MASKSTTFNVETVNKGYPEPTLTQYIKTVLQQYPDDGQILKEIIQNADDAKATQVKFLLDLNEYPSDCLIKPGLEEYQGPALLAFNDGLFRSEDWNEGIGRIYESVKKNDPLRVGRFGLGFKSVFHMTDFPSLISGTGIAFMDPHKQFFERKKQRGYENTSMFIFDIKNNHDEIVSAGDQWLPYKHSVLELNDQGFESGEFYNGTLFRFPLRKTSDSELSSTIYTPDRVSHLFNTIKNEGHLYLLFLRNIESIQLFSTIDGSMQKTFEVCLSNRTKNLVTAEKNKLINCILNGEKYSEIYETEIEIKHYSNNTLTSSEVMNFKTSQYYADQSVSEEMHKMASELKVIPLVGLAYPLNETSAKIGSQVFCFMPLTIEETNCTGLPVHINGYFSIDSNRKHLKKKNVNNENEDLQVEWNRVLTDTLLPLAMKQLVIDSISHNQFSRDQIYAMFPDKALVKPFWSNFAQNFYKAMQTCKIIQVETKAGTDWSIFDDVLTRQSNWSQEFTELSQQIFKLDEKFFAEIPEHIRESFSFYNNSSLKEATIEDVSLSFHKIQNSSSWNQRERLILLTNILQSGDNALLTGLSLVPLANRTWIPFTPSSDSQIIYLEHDDHKKEIIMKNMNERFINLEILPEPLITLLTSLAKSNETQLRLFSPQYFQIEIIESVKNPNPLYPGEDYLHKLWNYLYRHFSQDLDNFVGLHLLPVKNKKVEQLPEICESVIEDMDNSNSGDEKLMLISAGVSMIESLDQCARSHPQIRNHILEYNTEGKLEALRRKFTLDCDQFFKNVENMSSILRIELRKLLNSIPDNQILDFKQMITTLPIFDVLPSSNEPPKFVSIEKVNVAGPSFDYILPLPTTVINKDSKYSESLLQRSGHVSFLTTSDLLIQILETSISDHPIDQIETFVEKCLTIGQNNSTIWNLLSNTCFVRTRTRGILQPRMLLDPRDVKVKILFAEEDVFPVGVFSATSYLENLKSLGMRSICDVTDEEIVMIAGEIHNNPSQLYFKAESLLQFFEDNPKMWQQVKERISSFCWVPVHQERPGNYPENLVWAGRDCFTENVSIIKSLEHGVLCGSICRVCQSSSGMVGNEPTVEEVCRHLQKCIESYTPCCKGSYLQILNSIYEHFQTKCYTQVLNALAELKMEKWLLIGDEFVSPSECCFQRTFSDFSPYVFTVPSEFEQFRELLSKCGVEESCSYLRILMKMKEYYDKESEDSSEKERDLNYAISIINHLSRDSSINRDEIVLPIAGENLKFLPIKECAYCDAGLESRGIDIEDENLEEENIHLVHSNLSNQIAEELGVPSLLSVLLSDEDLGFDTGFGQEESLTTRLHNLLRDYCDGLAVMKELIQNADDAGASVLKLVYDQRQHKDHQCSLFDEKMMALQGPALLAYNDAKFSEDDFHNIVKLGGATKEQMSEKVGRFGVGFNSVYNLTEVPSFISANNVVFFDPHKKYLGKALRDKRQGGIKLDLRKRMFRRQLSFLSDQFHPFNGLFGCDLTAGSSMTSYEGTLFRFPLRNADQAEESEISNTIYSFGEMKELFRLLFENRHQILLFTENIKKVEVFHLKSDVDLIPLFSVEKKIFECFDSLSVREDSSRQNILHSTKLLVSENRRDMNRSTAVHQCVSQTCAEFKSSFSINSDIGEEEKRFLISSCSGIGESFEFALKSKKFLPIGGVAFEIGSDFHPVVRENSLLYCFLPLPIRTKLSFDMNGYFAVSSNRTELHCCNYQDKRNENAEWNEILMGDAVLESCLRSFEVLKENWKDLNAEQWYNLWPTVHSDSSVIRKFLECFYGSIVDGNEICLLRGEEWWSSFRNCVFLEADFERSGRGNVCRRILGQVVSDGQIVVSIPERIIKCMKDCGHCEFVDHQYDRERFYSEIILLNVDVINEEDYREFMVWTLFHLDEKDSFLIEALRESSCIPVSGRERVFVKPKHLIDPQSKLKVFFNEEDGRFPYWNENDVANCLHSENSQMSSSELYTHVLCKLRLLGMVRNGLPWNELVERSLTVKNQNVDLGYERNHRLLKLMKENLESESLPEIDEKSKLLSIQFLPILKKDLKTNLVWNSKRSSLWCSPNEGFSEESKNLVFCSCPVIDRNKTLMSESLLKFFDLNDKLVSMDKVENQIIAIRDLIESETNLDLSQKSELKSILLDIFSYFESSMIDGNHSELSIDLREVCVIYCEEFECFVKPNKCVQNGSSFPPYIYSLDRNQVKDRFPNLLSHLNIPECASADCYVNVLRLIYEEHHGGILSDEIGKISVKMILELSECIEKNELNICDLSVIYAPDNKKGIIESSKLCYNVYPWLEDDQFQFIHPDIPYKKAKLLGVKENRSYLLSKHQYGLAFGQKEKLTRRINTILSGYPFDVSILKELLQNADDAGAEELHFILDWRVYGSERVFSDGWNHLQGAALLVYNNREFSESDLIAIQNLGEGNKRDDPMKTGQYGVGFNCVYHLTDCPTFLTTIQGQGECLCAFDPHLKYVPDATSERPGQRFTNISYLEDRFPDVFECYRNVQSAIGCPGGTLFRLPLRTKEMAECNDIVEDKREVTGGRVKTLLMEMSSCLRDYLLFLKNVKSIKLSEFDKEGNLKSIARSDAEIESSCFAEVEEFQDHVKSQAKDLKVQKSLDNAALKEVSYKMKIKTSRNGRNEEGDWLIVQRFGVSENAEIPKDLLECYKEGSLGLLPIGGLAVPLPENKCYKNFYLFCLLPLPLKSHFPVHINGHFALDYESRRILSSKKVGTEWNLFLMKDIIGPAYLSILTLLKKHLQCSHSRDTSGNLDIIKNWYFNKFPSYYDKNDSDKWMSQLTLAVIKLLSTSKEDLYPMVSPNDVDNFNVITWHIIFPFGGQKTFFNNIHNQIAPENSPFLCGILKRFGMILIDCPDKIMSLFGIIRVTLNVICPLNIIEHFRQHCDSVTLEGKYVTETPFQSVCQFQIFFNYIMKKLDPRLYSLENMPFMLNNLGNVCLLHRNIHIYYSEYLELLPGLDHRFVLYELDISESMKSLLKSYCHVLTIEDLAQNLTQVFANSEFRLSPVKLEKLFEVVQRNWITLLWDFIGSKFQEHDPYRTMNTNNFLFAIQDWCFVPVFKGNEKLLVPINHLNGVIYLKNSFERSFLLALRKLKVYEPYLGALVDNHEHWNNHVGNILINFCGKPENPSDILHALNLASNNFPSATLEIPEAESLCQKIDAWISSNTSTFMNQINLLKKIPMYVDVCQNVTAIEGRVYTLPDGLPTQEMDHWLNDESPIVFLRPVYLHLYKMIQCQGIEIDVLYLDIIFKTFSSLSQSTQINHISYIKNIFNCENQWGLVVRNTEMIAFLKRVEFIWHHETQIFHSADFYYFNESFKIFDLMRPKEILPQEYSQCGNWISFLEELGLNSKICDETICTFAREISQSKDSNQSQQLTRYLCRCTQNSNLLSIIKSIPFLEPFRVSTEFSAYHPQFGSVNGIVPFIAFEGSVNNDVTDLCWTQCNILSNKMPAANAEFKQTVGLITKLSMNVIHKHLLSLCSKIDTSANNKLLTKKLLAPIFKYFEENNMIQMSSSEMSRFGNSNIVPLENLSTAVKPIHVITNNLTVEDQIEPFLCKLPMFLGEFVELFIKLGATSSLNSSSYAEVLYQYYNSQNTRPIEDPELPPKIKKATIGFLKQLEKGEYDFTKQLFLPTVRHGLQKSQLVIYIDNPALKSRIEELNQPIFDYFSSDLDLVKLFDKLPASVRPTAVSDKIKEEIISKSETKFSDESIKKLRNKFCDIDFIDGILRILFHHHSEYVNTLNELSVKETLETVSIIPVLSLSTVLKYENNSISSSQSTKNSFLCFEDNSWNIYIRNNLSENQKTVVLTTIAEYLLKILTLRSSPAAHLISLILTVDSHLISSTLDSFSIRQYDSDGSTTFLFPPGTLLPLDLHDFVIQEVKLEYSLRAYVAYQSFDPEDQNQEPVYIVGRVLKMLKDDTQSMMNRCEIDLGDGERKIVSILYLYSYHTAIENEANINEDIDQAPRGFDINQVKIEVQRLVRIKQNLPPELKKQLIKRLLLKWHPDKNPNHREACSLIYEFLKGLFRESSQILNYCVTYASHRASYHSSGRNSGSIRQRIQRYRHLEFNNPQPTEARRWMAQAEFDLKAAMNDQSGMNISNEWVCLKCHQASEKALKAVLLSTDGNHSRDHNLPSLCSDPLIVSVCESLENIGSSTSFRYPDQHQGTIPHNVYTPVNSSNAINFAEQIVTRCRRKLN